MLKRLVSFAHVVVFLLHLHLKDHFCSNEDAPFFGTWILSAPSVIIRSLSLFAIGCVLFLFRNNIAQKNTLRNENIVTHVLSFSIVIILSVAINTNLNECASVYTVNALCILGTTTNGLKQWFGFVDARDLRHKFTNTSANTINSNHLKAMCLVIYVIYNVMLNCYSYVYIKRGHVFNFVQYSSNLLILSVCSLPFYIMSAPKYDIYHSNPSRMVHNVLVLSMGIFQLSCVYISSTLCDEWNQQRRFIKKCIKNKANTIWSSYIIQNHANYERFLFFLSDIYCLQDLLCMIDVMQYKNELELVLDALSMDIKYGYRLPFMMTNDVLPTSPIVMELENAVRQIDAIDANKVMNVVLLHFAGFIEKYTASILSINLADANAVGPRLDRKLADLMTTNSINDKDPIEVMNDIITLFDDVLIQTNRILQLLFREFQLRIST
eukprot:121229_1